MPVRTPVPVTVMPVWQLCLLSLILFLSGSSLLATTATTLTVTQQFGYIATQINRDLVETIYIYATLGTFLGSFFWGVLSDAFGRKWALMVCLLLSLGFMLARALCTSLAWLPLLSFSSCLANGSLVVVKAYAGDILDSANSATGFIILGVCSICVNAVAVLFDLALYSILPDSKSLLIPSVLESVCIVVVLVCIQVFLTETIRVSERKPTSPAQGQPPGQGQVEMTPAYEKVVADEGEVVDIELPDPAGSPRASPSDSPGTLPSLAPRSAGIMKKPYLKISTAMGDAEDCFDDEPVFLGDAGDSTAGRYATPPLRQSTPPPPPRTLSPTPSSPLRRNVSFSGLVTVKVIGSENLAVGRLKTLPFDENPLSSVASDGVAPRNAPTGVVGGSARGLQRAASADGLSLAGARPLSPLSEDATPSPSSGVVATSGTTEGGGATNDSRPTPAAGEDSNDIMREYCEDSDDYLQAFCGDGAERSRDLDPGQRHSGSSTFRAATQLLSTFGSLRYANGAEFYESQLSEITALAVVAKTLRSLLMRNTVLLSTGLYATNMCVVTAVSLSCPVWLLYHAPLEGEQGPTSGQGGQAAFDPVHNPSGMALAGDDVIFIVAVSFVLSVLLLVKFFAMSVRNWKVVFCYRLGVRFTIAGVLLVPTIFSVQQLLRVPFYAYLYVIGVYSLISLGSMWSLMSTILMVNNSGYKWERGTVFGLAETVGCVGKLAGVLISRYFYDLAVRSRQKWPFDSAIYWYALALLLYCCSGLAACLPKSILVRLQSDCLI